MNGIYCGLASAVFESAGSVRAWAVLGLSVGALATGACTAGRPDRHVVVGLSPVVDTAPARWWGMTNIFFDSVPPGIRDSVQVGHGWTGIELADVVRGDTLATVYAARFRLQDTGEMHYVVASAGRLDFATSPLLILEQRNGIAVANLTIDVRTLSGSHQHVPYQILHSGDGYTYARIAEYLQGRARLQGRDYWVRVRNASRNDPFFALNEGTRFWIARGGADSIEEQPSVTAFGRAVSSDEVFPGTPFQLAGRPYELAEIAPDGARLVLRQSTARSAAAPGFEAPAFTARLLSGGRYQFGHDRGKVVLVEFWSTDCHFSELARPRLNDLAAQLRGAPFSWVALAREGDSASVQQYLAAHPMASRVALHDSAAWATYDRMIATPLFYLVDQRGVVRLRAVGVSAVDVVAAKIAELLRPVPNRSAPH